MMSSQQSQQMMQSSMMSSQQNQQSQQMMQSSMMSSQQNQQMMQSSMMSSQQQSHLGVLPANAFRPGLSLNTQSFQGQSAQGRNSQGGPPHGGDSPYGWYDQPGYRGGSPYGYYDQPGYGSRSPEGRNGQAVSGGGPSRFSNPQQARPRQVLKSERPTSKVNSGNGKSTPDYQSKFNGQTKQNPIFDDEGQPPVRGQPVGRYTGQYCQGGPGSISGVAGYGGQYGYGNPVPNSGPGGYGGHFGYEGQHSGAHPGGIMKEPIGPTIDRGGMRDVASVNYQEGQQQQPQTCWATTSTFFTVFKRLISACFIISDLVLDWMQFAEWGGDDGAQPDSSFVNGYHAVHNDNGVECDDVNTSLINWYGVSCGLGTVFAIYQLVNMVGETLMEVNKKRFGGFQILHGWIESALSVFCEEIPQNIMVFFFNCKKSNSLMYALLSIIVGNIKNEVRKSTCKQKPRDCCKCECCKCEMVYVCDCVMLCTTITYIVCGRGKCCECEIERFQICPGGCWNREGKCFGEITEDPDYAERIYDKGAYWHRLLIIATIIYKLITLVF